MNFYLNRFRQCSEFYKLVYKPFTTLKYHRTIPVVHVLSFSKILNLGYINKFNYPPEDENKDSELIMTLKRSILATRREEYEKAEQLLHVALRLAQQQQNEQGITYCYDLMANVAFDQRELNKAEKLFVSVLQRLLSKGTSQDDIKVIHISLKLARIYHLKAENEKAQLGYTWCLDQIKNKKDTDSKLLHGVIQDWYAQFLLDVGEVSKSITHLNEAYQICSEVNGKNCEQSMLLLNDLGTTNWRAGELEKAENCLMEAVRIGKRLDDQIHVGVVLANLGLINLERGVVKEAENNCKQAWSLGKLHENQESLMQATYCINQIKEFFKAEQNINNDS